MLFYPQNIKIDYEKELNSEQLKVVREANGAALVLAGAGSGKTRTLIYRLAYLLEQGIEPKRILLMTFTNKAAKEMMSRVEKILGIYPTDLWGGTFHHIGNKVLRLFGEKIGLPPNFNILDSEDSKELVKACYRELELPDDKKFPKPEVMHKMISLSANLNESLEKAMRQRFAHLPKSYLPYLMTINDLYRQKKETGRALDFDDLLAYWLRLMMIDEGVKNKLASQFQYILVDEFQDTNRLQGEIIKLLAEQSKNLLVVGDDAQSIYSFRGADVNNILQFPKNFPACQIFKLETNYRSAPEILTLANQSIAKNYSQFKKELVTVREPFNKPMLVELIDPMGQAEFVAEEILALHEERNLSWKEIAVLFRSHYQSLELELVLQQKHIPYEMRGGLRFFEQAHVKDVLAFVKILANHKDESAWRRILAQLTGVGPAQSDQLISWAGRFDKLTDLINAADPDFFTKKALLGWQTLKNLIKNLLDKTEPSEILNFILDQHYFDYLAGAYDNAIERAEDLRQLVLFARNYKKIIDLLNDALLTENFRGQKPGEKKKDIDAVILSTIHQAKGLEWPAVFVIGLAEGQFPNSRMFSRPQELEEERRLFYVAVTRAEKWLYLTYPVFNSYGGAVNKKSQFIRELPDGVYERVQIEARVEE